MIIVSGPSTVGKNPFIYEACKLYDLDFWVPYTTRAMRCEESHGKDYFFLPKLEFQSKILEGEIKEWDYCLNNYYGYSYVPLGRDKVITHGLSRLALRIKDKYPQDITTIFLMPCDMNKIFNNLKEIYKGKDLLLRETLVEEEICHSKLFDSILMVTDSVRDLLEREETKQIILSGMEKNLLSIRRSCTEKAKDKIFI